MAFPGRMCDSSTPPSSAGGPSQGAVYPSREVGVCLRTYVISLKQRAFPAEIMDKQEGFGQGCWEAGGGDTWSPGEARVD